ncbi:hypothetical protein BKA62DRAFT_447035 [Auriculariales sp. MPI-PUGE-AT-0066]|nr:hypothetical protein BKA62DRAFT_447035 [Auriculariales sp. MPI-PUGE-AT-0066]
MASVHLPVEMWCSAWEFLPIMECFNIAQVCRSWRRAACAWPRLWTQLSYKDYPASNADTELPEDARLVITEVQLLDLFAERSAPMPLDVKSNVLRDCYGDADQAQRLVKFSQLLARNASRLRSLFITIDSIGLARKILFSLPHSLPHLETLYIADGKRKRDKIELDFYTPALKNLQLCGIRPSRVMFNVTAPLLHHLTGWVNDARCARRLLSRAFAVQELQVDVHSNFHPTDAETQLIRRNLPPWLDTLKLECRGNNGTTHEYALSNFYDAAIRNCTLFLTALGDGHLQGFLADVTQPSDIWCLPRGELEEQYMVRGNDKMRTIRLDKAFSRWDQPFLCNLWAQLAPCAAHTVVKLAVHSQLLRKVMPHIPCENAIQELRFYFDAGTHSESFAAFDAQLEWMLEDEDYNVSLPQLRVVMLCIDRSHPELERPIIWNRKSTELAARLSKMLDLGGERPLQRLELRELRFKGEDPAATSCPWQSLAHEVLYT